jgi:hypothetical protein
MSHGIEDEIKSLVYRFKEVLDSKEGILKCFAKYEVQVEDWFKGEFIYFLDDEKAMGRLADFEQEVPLEAGRADFKVEVSTNSGMQEALIELLPKRNISMLSTTTLNRCKTIVC